MYMSQIIIAISGTSGTGKTTLAKELSKKYDLAIKPENIHPLIDSFKKVLLNKDPKLQNQLITNYVQIAYEWLDERQEFIQKNNRCILDRWALDILARFLFSNLFNINSDPIYKLIELIRTQSESLTVLIIPSIIQSSIPTLNEDNLARSSNMSRRIYSQASTIGLAKMYTRCPTILIPNQMTQLESRVNSITKAIDKILNRSLS